MVVVSHNILAISLLMSSQTTMEGGLSNPFPDDKTRFLVDLEFIQNLSNPHYLHFLAQQKYFQKPEFIRYLKYLSYWKSPEYARFLLFPQCLAVLDLLLQKGADNTASAVIDASGSSVGSNNFIEELNFPQFADFYHQQQGMVWMKGRPQQTTEVSTAAGIEAIKMEED
jgi:hypothetical protein